MLLICNVAFRVFEALSNTEGYKNDKASIGLQKN